MIGLTNIEKRFGDNLQCQALHLCRDIDLPSWLPSL